MEKQLVQYSVVDAFTDTPFKGNPAAVCHLEEERHDGWLQCVAAEFNISETCYLIPVQDTPSSPIPRFQLRWFTPVAEVKLCGHATLAAAHSLFTSRVMDSDIIEFTTLSGILTAKRFCQVDKSSISNIQNGIEREYLIELDFPAIQTFECDFEELSLISKALNGASPVEVKKTASDDIFVVLLSGKIVENFQPQFDAIRNCPGRGLIITGASPNSKFDFISRFFCPKLGIDEDPVCGSAHCALATYWRKKLGKSDFVAFQASPRSGILHVQLDEKEQRVKLRGKAVTVMKGSLFA